MNSLTRRAAERYVAVIIPAYNEKNSVRKVIRSIPREWANEIIVVNNNSCDDTRKQALEEGAIVLDEKRQGYGFACLKGLEYLKSKETKPAIVVFLDADYSDYPQEMGQLVKPIFEDGYDLVIGSRALGKRERGSMTFAQVFGNRLAVTLLRILYGVKYTDLGPFRAIRYDALLALGMKDTTYGWTVEMQLKAARRKLKVCEVPVRYRRRTGFSKISGTVKGTLLAGYKIIATILKYL